MNLLNVIILLILGMFNISFGIILNSNNWISIIVKTICVFGGTYLMGYSLYLSNILFVN